MCTIDVQLSVWDILQNTLHKMITKPSLSIMHVYILLTHSAFYFPVDLTGTRVASSLHCPEFTLSMLTTTQQRAPRGSALSSSTIIPVITLKECIVVVCLLLLEYCTSSSYSSFRWGWQLCNISDLLSLDQHRSVKGRRQGAFICMRAPSHKGGISLRHGESCGLHDAWGEQYPAVRPTRVKQYCLCLTGFTLWGSRERARNTR